MNKRTVSKKIAAAAIAAILMMLPVAAAAQTTNIKPPKNKYPIQEDIKLGDQAAAEVERQFPIINDPQAAAYITRVGDSLVAAIPRYLQHPEFNYRFKWVNASDINAFALPGGAMYINRGMIEAAHNEGEMAGVMAHELSHVVLRHATAQETKQTSAGSTLRNLGLILGGAVLGGEAGAQLGAVAAAGWMLKYSREYESQADALGAQIMANAGYDPQDLANVFRTIQQQEKGGSPQWLSDHPDPGNRYEKISQMARTLHVSNPIKITRDFETTQAKFRAMPPARTMAQIERGGANGNGGNATYGNNNPTSSGRYSDSVQYPSSSLRSYAGLNWVSLSVPSNWRDFTSSDGVQFAPDGAYGDQGITRGVMIGTLSGSGDLSQDTQNYLSDIMQGNSYLRQRDNTSRASVGGRQGFTAGFSGSSPVTGRTEDVTVYTTQLNDGRFVYITTVVPDDESRSYSRAFQDMLDSLQFGR